MRVGLSAGLDRDGVCNESSSKQHIERYSNEQLAGSCDHTMSFPYK